MGCLYCGKEIGTFRALRGDEFCSPAHRKLYGDRLGKALGRMSELEPQPIGMAGFLLQMPLQDGNRRPAARSRELLTNAHCVSTGASAGVSITPLLGTIVKPVVCPAALPPERGAITFSPAPIPSPIRFTSYFPDRLALSSGITGGPVSAAPPVPSDTLAPRIPRGLFPSPAVRLPLLPGNGSQAAKQKWMPVPAAMPAQRSRVPSTAAAVPRKLQPELPRFEKFAIGGAHVAPSSRWQKPAPSLATMPARPRVDLEPMEIVRDEPVPLRYPDLGGITPDEELLKEVKVVPPAGFRASSAPLPADRPPATATLEHRVESSPLLTDRQAGAVVMPPAPDEILTGNAQPEIAPLRPSAEPAAVEPEASAAPTAAGPFAWEPRPCGLHIEAADLQLTTQVALAPFMAPAPASPAVSSAPQPIYAAQLEWAPRQPRSAATDLPLASERALAPFAESQPAMPVESMPVAPPFEAAPMGVRPGDYGLALPDIVHRPLYAQPPAAPATRVAQFPRVPRGKSRSANCALTGPSLCLPKYTPAGPVGDVQPTPLVPRPVSFLPVRSAAPAGQIDTVPATELLPFSTPDQTPELSAAAFDPAYPNPVEPAPDAPHNADLRPIPTLPVNPAAIEAECTPSAVPAPGFIPVEFYLQRAAASPHFSMEWASSTVALKKPPFILPLIEDRTEDDPVPRPVEQTPSTVTEIFSHPDAKRLARKRMMSNLTKIAACLIVGVFVWFGTRALTFSSERLLANRTIEVLPSAPAEPAVAKAAPAPASGAPRGFLARAQMAIARRATVEVGDNFKGGMESWGATASAWAPGWSRNAAGYINMGGLELFSPSRKFKDYRLEFFGQIESKGMGWVMRGQDKQNYYAMKFQVIQNGLRPVIAMVHYPVVDGKKGQKSETPLNIMVHNNEPFHVSVDVAGNRFTASVEGQKIESWTDDTPAAGAAGFFTEASERARLYWMKVTKNDDFLGSICSFLAGDSAREAAEVWGPGIPADGPIPAPLPRPADAILAEATSGLDDFENLQYRRNRVWNS